MITTFGFRRGVVQALTVVCLAICAGGLLGYVQAERQVPGLTSSVVAGAAPDPASAARASTPASGAANSTAAGQGSDPRVAHVDTRRKQVAGSGPRAADGPAPSDTSLAPAWPFWEFKLKEPVPPREPPLTPLNWRLIGAANSGNVWQVVILRQGSPGPEFFRVGQSLPGGYFIEAISEEDVTLVHRRRRMIVAYIGS